MSTQQTCWGKKGIWATLSSHQSGGTEEWESVITLYSGKKRIGCIDENNGFMLQGNFDFIEEPSNDEIGIQLRDETLCLDVSDITKLLMIAQWNTNQIEGNNGLDDIWEPFVESPNKEKKKC